MLPLHFQRALEALDAGGVIAYPTEAVWGLGCDPFDAEAVERILYLKQRPVEKGLIVVAASAEQVAALVEPLTSHQKSMLRETWPGPTTWLLPDPDQCFPSWVRGNFSSVAVRVSAHPLVRKLCLAYGGPLISTSANPSTLPPARSRIRVEKWFGREVDYVLPGRLGGNPRPSTIRDINNGEAIRL